MVTRVNMTLTVKSPLPDEETPSAAAAACTTTSSDHAGDAIIQVAGAMLAMLARVAASDGSTAIGSVLLAVLLRVANALIAGRCNRAPLNGTTRLLLMLELTVASIVTIHCHVRFAVAAVQISTCDMLSQQSCVYYSCCKLKVAASYAGQKLGLEYLISPTTTNQHTTLIIFFLRC
jgi:hypothetical protein